jgi:hypothetical protein
LTTAKSPRTLGWPKPLDTLQLRQEGQSGFRGIDPHHTVRIDRDNFNNSFVVEPNHKPTYKLSTCWLFLSQWVSQAIAWWAI